MFEKIIDFISRKILSNVKWTWAKYILTGRTYNLRPVDREVARRLMCEGHYLWVARRNTHLSTYLISFSDWFLGFLQWAKCKFKGDRPKFGYWSHAFMNYDEDEVVEAVAKGVQKVFFDEVFDCDSAAALVPRNMLDREWKAMRAQISNELENQIGKKYDTMFNLTEDVKVSCIELARLVLKRRVKDYDLKFSNFESMIKKYKNVTPQMLYDSKDFVVVWEKRRAE